MRHALVAFTSRSNKYARLLVSIAATGWRRIDSSLSQSGISKALWINCCDRPFSAAAGMIPGRVDWALHPLCIAIQTLRQSVSTLTLCDSAAINKHPLDEPDH